MRKNSPESISAHSLPREDSAAAGYGAFPEGDRTAGAPVGGEKPIRYELPIRIPARKTSPPPTITWRIETQKLIPKYR